MQQAIIHTSYDAAGTNRLTVTSHGNGLAYAVQMGSAGEPMRTLFLQGDDAITFRDEFDAMEQARPYLATRDIWLVVLDAYL